MERARTAAHKVQIRIGEINGCAEGVDGGGEMNPRRIRMAHSVARCPDLPKVSQLQKFVCQLSYIKATADQFRMHVG
jgi:hypothetical protein